MIRLIGRACFSVLGGAVIVGTALWAVNDARQLAMIRQLEAEKAELQRMVARFKNERRVAQLYVSKQDRDESGRVVMSHLDFKEIVSIDQDARARPIEVPGDVVYVDALVVHFSDEYVERGDALRGHSLHLFRRIFGQEQRPIDGPKIDREREVPAAYRTQGAPGEFERKLWEQFWDYAANPESAARAGVRVAQGEAVYQRVSAGQLWQIATRAGGGLEFRLQPVDPLIQSHLTRQP